MARLVDYFVVCGLRGHELLVDANAGYVSNQPPLSQCYSSHVLCHFPEHLDYLHFDEGAIRTQCMPDGLRLVKNSVPDPEYHTMVITRENGSRVYGSTLTFYEPVQDPELLNAVGVLQSEYVSKCRFGISPDESLLFNRYRDKLYSSTCLCFVTSLPIFAPLKPYLEQLYAVTLGSQNAALPIESYLYNILYEVCLPEPGRTVCFSGPLGPISWYLPGKWDFPLCDYLFRVLFEQLGVKNVIKFLTCVLLEQQILLKSSDFFNLMLCAECITNLLFPFSWPHVFVPILPASQMAFLDAPVPFIMGLRMDSDSINEELDLMNKASLCSVNIDLGAIDVPEEVPILPDHERLFARLSDVLVHHDVVCPGVDKVQRPVSPSSGESKKTHIMDAIRYVKSMSEDPTPVLPSSRGTTPLTHSSSLTKVTDHPIVKEIQGIMVRSGRGKKCVRGDGVVGEEEEEEEEVPTSVSPTTGVLEMDNRNKDDDEEDGGGGDVGVAGKWDFCEDGNNVSFNIDVRMVFLNYFVEHFANYEHFSIMPNQTYQQWMRNREQFLNFDKTAFLSDQPINHRPFHSAFLETTMFTNMIDQKLISWWEPDLTSPNLLLFDKHVERYRQNNGIPTTPSAGNTPNTPTDFDETSGISRGTEVAPKPHHLGKSENSETSRNKDIFPSLDSTLLLAEVERTVSPNNIEKKTPKAKSNTYTKKHETSTGAFSHSKFVMQLWRESRSRVKHMLGSSAEAQSNIEANTHISNLCDLLERIWGHGLKKRESKSPLWAHLMAFGELLCREDQPLMTERNRAVSTPNVYYPQTLSSRPQQQAKGFTKSMSTSRKSMDETGSPQTRRTLPLSRQKFQSPALRMRIEAILQPPASSFLDDLQIVNNMREIKTDVGRARAWVRLALEKKSLSRHLTQLLSNIELCKKRYRHYAFLLTEDEKEQFLLHLLSLSAGDFTSFTTGFSTTNMSYKVLIVGEGKYFGLSTACLYVNVGGENRVSGVLEIPRGEYQLEFTCPNLGMLTCLRLGHDNTGLVRSLLVEMVLVHCVTTGQTYKFSCSRPLARAEDDGSIERFIVAERVSRKLKGSANISALGVTDVIPSSSGVASGRKWSRSPKKESNERPMLSDIKASLSNCISNMLKTLEHTPKETVRGRLLSLLYGGDGLIKCLEAVFNFGFKSSRKFHRPLYIWDMIERALEGIPGVSSEEGEKISEEEAEEECSERSEEDNLGGGSFILGQGPNQTTWRHFASVISKINRFSRIGRDEKVTILFSVGLRDRHLVTWIQLLACSTAIHSLYDPTSFLRDPEQLAYLLETMKPTKTLSSVVCEPLLVQGL